MIQKNFLTQGGRFAIKGVLRGKREGGFGEKNEAEKKVIDRRSEVEYDAKSVAGTGL